MSLQPPPHIAILIPLYNGVEYFPQALKSVISQTVPHTLWELIIGINGHIPNSPTYQKVLEEIAITVPLHLRNQIRVFDLCIIPNPPKGKSQTLNLLTTAAHPMVQWIALLDVDDIWLSTKLQNQLPYIYMHRASPAYDVIGTQCDYINVRGELMGTFPTIPLGDISNISFKAVNPIINSSVLIRRELAYWDPKWDGVEDYELWIRLRSQNARFFNCSEHAVLHRIHPSSAFNGTSLQQSKLLTLLTS